MTDDRTAEIIHPFDPGTPGDQAAEGLRLVKAFMRIRDPVLRDALIGFAERIAEAGARRGQTGGS